MRCWRRLDSKLPVCRPGDAIGSREGPGDGSGFGESDQRDDDPGDQQRWGLDVGEIKTEGYEASGKIANDSPVVVAEVTPDHGHNNGYQHAGKSW